MEPVSGSPLSLQWVVTCLSHFSEDFKSNSVHFTLLWWNCSWTFRVHGNPPHFDFARQNRGMRFECSISSITSRAGPSRIGECVTYSTLRRLRVDNFGRYGIARDNFVNHLNPTSVKVVWLSLRQQHFYRFPLFPWYFPGMYNTFPRTSIWYEGWLTRWKIISWVGNKRQLIEMCSSRWRT